MKGRYLVSTVQNISSTLMKCHRVFAAAFVIAGLACSKRGEVPVHVSAACASFEAEQVCLGESSSVLLARLGPPEGVRNVIQGIVLISRWEYRSGRLYFYFQRGGKEVLTGVLAEPEGLDWRIVEGQFVPDTEFPVPPVSVKLALKLGREKQDKNRSASDPK